MAPRHKLGIKRPQGTFMPKVKTVATNLKTRARDNNRTALYTPGPAAAISMAELTSVKFLL